MNNYVGDDIELSGRDTVYAASGCSGRVFVSVQTGACSFSIHVTDSEARALAAQLIAAADYAEGGA